MRGPLGRLVPVMWAAAVAALPAGAAPPDRPARLDEVTLLRQPSAVVVQVRTTAHPRFTSTVIDGPHRVVVDFADTRYAWRREPWAVGEPPVKEIRGSQFRPGVARLVVELTQRAAARVVPRPDGVDIVVPAARAPAGRVGAVLRPPGRSAVEPAAAGPAPGAETDGGRPPRPGPGPGDASRAAGAGLRLQGIVVVDGTAVAYIEQPPAAARGYRVGDAVADGRVEAISVDTVVIRRPQGPLELRIPPPGSGPPAP